MTNRDLIELCFRNLLRRRTRTLLAVIGVVVGTCAIVVMLSIGFGLSENNQKQIESYGNLHVITVRANEGMASRGNTNGILNDQTISEISKMEGVTAITPVVETSVAIVAGKKVASTQIIGIKPEVFEKFNYAVEDGGRMLRSSDKEMILFGNQITHFFHDPSKDGWSNDEFPVMQQKKMFITGDDSYGFRHRQERGNESEKIKYPEFKVRPVGVLSNPDDDSAYNCYMNIEFVEKFILETQRATKERIKTGRKTYEQALIYVDDINLSGDVSKALREKNYGTYSPSDWLDSVKKTSRMIQGILGGIGGISLLVAALGITNTMIMSIYERTKEIGVMKVIGANLGDIRKMFMLEAGLIGFLGGLAGLIFSIVVSILMNTVLRDIISMAFDQMMGGMDGNISHIPIWLAFASVGFATLIGLLAGYYPAKRAMELSAL
ncbi:MAG: ABC transporter permease, partial [Eubacteriales bacterium]